MQQILEQQGILATSVQQVDQLLSSDAFLIAAGYIKGASINLVPVRTQIGGTADWSTRGAHKRDLSYNFLYNDNQALLGSTLAVVHTLAFTQSITRSDTLSLSCSIMGLKNPGRRRRIHADLLGCLEAPVPTRALFRSFPSGAGPSREMSFETTSPRESSRRHMPPMPEVEVMLDDRGGR